jgi:polyphenol oxidase
MMRVDAAFRKRIVSPQLAALPGVVHGFGVRGVALPEYLEALSLRDARFAETNQVHGNVAHRLAGAIPEGRLEGDAFMTNQSGVVCHVRSADCVPIIIADPARRAVAAVHAGWRGTACDVAGSALAAMRRAFGTDPAGCVAAIGPRICGDCYEVGDEVREALEALAIGRGWRAGEKRVDLGKANAALLARAGLRPENIDLLPHCTFCDESFTSYRRDQSEAGRQVNFIVIRK